MEQHAVTVVGAGFGGLAAGIKLKQAGIPFVILEQADDVGGTWRANTYPGVAVDINSFSYSFSFEPNPNWSRSFAPGSELRAYASHLADKYELRPHIRFNTRVQRSRFDAEHHLWRSELADGGEVTSRYLIAAPGGLTQPKYPTIEGLEGFKGKSMHTAHWDHGHDVRGKRVAVIGTGASAVQVIPTIAPDVKQLHVFQRTPIWVMPKTDFPIPAVARILFRFVPPTQLYMRVVSGTATEGAFLFGAIYNKQLPYVIKTVEQIGRAFLRFQVRDPELRAKLTPRYGFGCKRPVVSNDYFPSFNRDNVELVTDPIDRITATGIKTADGRLRKVDTIVHATGYKVFELGNTPSFEVIGLDGLELGRFWDEHRYQAYESTSVPQFPNAFTLLGPYGLGGASYLAMVETNVRHAIRCIKEARRRGASYVAVRQDAHDAYFQDILERMGNTVFFNNNCAGAHSYYFDRHGDAPMLRPHTGIEMWWRSRTFNLDHYEFRSLAEQRAQRSASAVAAS
jgi:cation diffusion facilitator CzcD-associated flavoprotein CzcO